MGIGKGDRGWFKYSKGVPRGVINERVWYGIMTIVHGFIGIENIFLFSFCGNWFRQNRGREGGGVYFINRL